MNARALLLLSVASLSACVDLSPPRAYRCAQDTDCVGGWVCRDQYCRAPDAGAAFGCDSANTCTGGWFCGKDAVCHSPTVGAALSCDRDDQCPTGWRCGLKGACIDTANLPTLSEPVAPAGATVHSPLIPPGDDLRSAPLSVRPSPDGGVRVVFAGARAYDGGVLVTSLAWDQASFVEVSHQFLPMGPIDDFAVQPDALLTRTGGTLTLHSLESGTTLDFPTTVVPGPLSPLTWNLQSDGGGLPDSVRGFHLSTPDTQSLVVWLDGGTEFSRDAQWVAPLTLDPNGVPLYARMFLPFMSPLYRLVVGDSAEYLELPYGSGQPLELRSDYQQHLSVRTTVALISICPGCKPVSQFSPGSRCADGHALRDWVWGPSSPTVVCVDDDLTETLTSADPNAPPRARYSIASHGVSGGSAHLLPAGQLGLGADIESQIYEALPTTPVSLGIFPFLYDDGGVGPPLISAVAGGALYGKLLASLPDSPGMQVRLVPHDDGFAMAGLVENTGEVITRSGALLSQRDVIAGLEREVMAARGWLHAVDGGAVWVVQGDDTLYAASRDDSLQVLQRRVTPFPGFAIEDLALRPGETTLLEGWAVANNQLLQVTASTIERWRSSVVALEGLDPVNVWFDGDAAVVGTTTGEVVLLPERLVLAPPLGDEVLSMGGVCGMTVATTATGVWRLARVGGALKWVELPDLSLSEARVFRFEHQLVVADFFGQVVEFTCP